MEPSTPQRADLLKFSLLNATNLAASPLRRRGSILQMPNLLTPVDDDEERNIRRSLVATIGSNASPLSDSTKNLNESQIGDHLRICRKLYTENRISSKNAWDLHVIDVMKRIALSNNANVLQEAGSSLDVGSKVYGLRVDDVHTKGMQLASSMMKSNEKKHNEENDELDQTHKRNPRKKSKKLSTDKKNVIDKEGKNLFGPIAQVEVGAFSTKESIDVCATDNLFTHKLATNPATHLFMQMSEEKYWEKAPDKIFANDGIEESLELPQIKHFSMCPAFKKFEIGNWDREHEEKQLAVAPSLSEAIVDEEGIPIPELDGSIHDIFENEVIADETTSDPDEEIQNVVRIEDAIPEEHRIETDYGYNTLVRITSGKYVDKIWAGPNHWKVKYIKQSSARFSGCTAVVKHAKKVKKARKIVFHPTEDVCKTMKLYVPKRKTTSIEPTLLPVPECFHKFDKLMDELLSKPIPKRVLLSNNFQQCEMGNMSNSSHDNMDEGNEEPMQTFEENVAIAAEEGFMGDNLVNAPELVSASQVPYAMQAKRMDMKKLKTAIFKRLVDDKGVVKPVDFSTVFSDVSHLLTSDMKKELTSPLAFVALLHLCNENNLRLDKKPNSNDFTISKAYE